MERPIHGGGKQWGYVPPPSGRPVLWVETPVPVTIINCHLAKLLDLGPGCHWVSLRQGLYAIRRPILPTLVDLVRGDAAVIVPDPSHGRVAGEEVEVLEEGETYSRVRTRDGVRFVPSSEVARDRARVFYTGDRCVTLGDAREREITGFHIGISDGDRLVADGVGWSSVLQHMTKIER